MKDFVLKCYDDYKVFIGLNDDIMPKLNPIILEQKDCVNNSLAYVITDEITSLIANIYINPVLNDFKDRFKISKLFHEFTHILDYINFSSKYNEKDLLSIMTTYSEYHASQIEIAYNVGLKNIYNIRKFNLDKTFITYENRQIKIEEDYVIPIANVLKIIDKPFDTYNELSAVNYFKNYKIFETKTMYYLAKRNFCEKISLSKIPNLTDKFYNSFAPYIRKLEEYIESKDFDNLIIARKGLWHYYTTHFICKERYILPKEL